MKDFNHDRISRYLDGEMNAEERNSFEAQMQQDADLKLEVELLKDVNETLKMKLHPGDNELNLRNTIKEMNDEYFSKKSEQIKIIPFRRYRWVAAAAAVLIFTLVLTIWSPWGKDDLYEQYAAIEMPGIAERSAATDSLLKLAVTNFNNKKFDDAIPSFETILKDSAQPTGPGGRPGGSQNAFVQYYYGIALLQNNQTERSRAVLTELYKGASLFKYDAAFYLALSFLKEKNNPACKDWLNKIPADAGPYVKAQELLKKL
jgi:hypothetical protein